MLAPGYRKLYSFIPSEHLLRPVSFGNAFSGGIQNINGYRRVHALYASVFEARSAETEAQNSSVLLPIGLVWGPSPSSRQCVSALDIDSCSDTVAVRGWGLINLLGTNWSLM